MKKISFLISYLLLSFSSFAQSYEECVKYFQNNKYTEAIAGLEQIQESGNKDASLLLAIIKADQEHYTESFTAFNKFYDLSENPYPYLYALINSGILNSNDHRNEVKQFLKKVINDPKADMTIKLTAMDHLANYSIKDGDFDAVRDIYKNTGDVKNWSTLGVFENISASGFDKDFGALEYPDSSHVFMNKSGVSIKWFDIKAVRNDRWYDFEYNYNIENSIIYAQTFINSEEDKDVIMKIGVSGSLKVWLNDYLVGSEPMERNTNSDVYGYKVKLQKGTNRLLVQLGSSELNKNNYMVRFFDLNNNLISDVQSDSHYKPYTKAVPYTVQQIPFFAEKYFEDFLFADSNNFINNLLLMQVYLTNENSYSAHKILKRLKRYAPYCTHLSEEAAILDNIDKNTIDHSKEKESVISNDPESYQGLILRYDDQVNKEKWDEALDILDRCSNKYGASENLEIKRISVLIKKKDNEKAIKEINDSYLQYPNSYDIVRYKYYAILEGSKNLNSANDVLEKYVENNYNVSLIEQIIENDFKLGEKDKGIRWYEKLLDNNPISVGIYAKYAMSLYDMHLYDKAITVIDKAIEIAPYVGRYYKIKGQCYLGKNQKEEAIAMWKKAIAYNPTDYTIRKLLTGLEGKKDLSDNFKENNIAALYADGRNNNNYDKEDGVCLLNDRRDIVYPEHGAVVIQNESLYLVKSQSAVERFKEFNIPYNSYTERLIVDKAEVLKKDGSKVAADRQKGRCVFSSIEIGDAIHISYKLEASYEGKLAEQFWGTFYFNGIYPVQTSRYSLIVPAERKFNFKTENVEITPTQKNIDEYTMYVWEENNIPKVIPEQAMSADNMQQLVVSSIPGWNYVANWYSDLSNEKTHADFEIKEKVKELMNGNEQKTALQKARIIYDYIEENFHYSSVPFLQSALTPQRASRTLNAKLGDCKDLSVLFVSMAREAGLDANLVLVRTKENGDNEFQVPNIAFNHCIAQLHTGDKDYLIELTNKYLPFSAMYINLINADGLYIPKNGRTVDNAAIQKLYTDNRPDNNTVRTADVVFDNDKAQLHRNALKIGSEAGYIRAQYADLNDEDRTKKLTQVIDNEFNKNIKMDSVIYEGLNDLTDTASIDYRFTVDKFITTIAGMKVFKMPWTESYSAAQAFSLDKRTYPLELWYLSSTPYNKETITIAIPAGKKLVEQPQDISLSCAAFTYNVKYKILGNKLTATRELKYLKGEITPAEYASVKDAVSQVLESDAKEIAFK